MRETFSPGGEAASFNGEPWDVLRELRPVNGQAGNLQ